MTTLADLERLCEQATKGPWLTHYGDGWISSRANGEPVARIRSACFTDQLQADMDLIAAAREWLPKLIAVARAAQTHECSVDENTGQRYCSDRRTDGQCSLHKALATLENSGS